jgi:Flp pilus assembly pilin Flp
MRTKPLRFNLQPQGEDGQAMVEYALILALITVVALTALTAVGETVQTLLQAIADHLAAIAGGL